MSRITSPKNSVVFKVIPNQIVLYFELEGITSNHQKIKGLVQLAKFLDLGYCSTFVCI